MPKELPHQEQLWNPKGLQLPKHRKGFHITDKLFIYLFNGHKIRTTKWMNSIQSSDYSKSQNGHLCHGSGIDLVNDIAKNNSTSQSEPEILFGRLGRQIFTPNNSNFLPQPSSCFISSQGCTNRQIFLQTKKSITKP